MKNIDRTLTTELEEMLRMAKSEDIVDLDSVRKMVNAMKQIKREQYLKKHSYTIWEGGNGRWYTYVSDETTAKGRKLIAKSSKEKLEEFLVEYYESGCFDNPAKITFKDMFERWVEEQKVAVSVNTIRKYRLDYIRFFEGSTFEKLNLTEINEINIKNYLIKLTKENKLTLQGTKNIEGYIRCPLRCAKVNHIITENPFDYVSVKAIRRFCVVKKKTAKERTFSETELKKLKEVLNKDHQTKRDYIPSYACEFLISCGLRVGEISAIKWSAIDYEEKVIHINCSEKRLRYEDKEAELVIENTKNNKERDIPISANMNKILEEIKTIHSEKGIKNEFVFADENGRYQASAISACMRRKCKQAGISVKSVHHMRRTFCSNLLNEHFPVRDVAELLGDDVGTVLKYYAYDMTDTEDRKKAIDLIERKAQ